MSKIRRYYETLRYVTPEQVLYRILAIGRRKLRAKRPQAAWDGFAAQGARLPLPDIASPRLAEIAQSVLCLERTVHGPFLDGISEGRFTFLNRTIDFKSPAAVDWRMELGEKNNPLWRMNLAYFGWAVPLLAQGGDDGLTLVAKILAGMDAQNHFSVPGVFRDVWGSYAVSHRILSLLAGAALHRRASPETPTERYAPLLSHVRFATAFLLHSLERDLQNNHLMKNFVALSTYAAALPDVPQDFAFLERDVPAAIRAQILPDGGQFERSPMYHVLAVLDVRSLKAAALFPSWGKLLAETERRMTDALAAMTHPDGDIALFNDSWIGEAPPPSVISPQTLQQDAAVLTLPDCGYTRLGDGHDAVLFDHGACGPDENPGHAHADFLSVEISVKGLRFVVDMGTPTYSRGKLRDLSRASASHNGPALNGIEPVDFWDSFRLGRRGRAWALPLGKLDKLAPLATLGTQNGYSKWGIEVLRFVALWPGRGALILDGWKNPGNHAPFTSWLLAPGWQMSGPSVFNKNDVRIVVRAMAGTLAASAEGQCWMHFGHPETCRKMQLMPKRSADAAFSALWFGWGGDEPLSEDVLNQAETYLRSVLG